ncbi:trypsin alpha-like [Anastrepha ludens]|uniref:trypsin alpha-like n=1 Tax=Anastrepha ludens TaxID=28586 RepID=UPI0023B00DBF|nr:trypsin alpha-like [Anastrepha ludens]
MVCVDFPSWVFSKRIVGGHRISITETPWQVAVIQSGSFICGGSIISSTWVMTAAHCVYGDLNKSYAVRAGSTSFKRGGQLRKVNRIIYNSGYNAKTTANDIALLRTAGQFNFGSKVQAVGLPTSDLEPRKYLVSGWGSVSENKTHPTKHLRGVNVYNVGLQRCKRNYRDESPITSKQICASARNQDACQGDSGGALVNQKTQYGIVSFGYGCARPSYPGIYTKVYRYLSWISKTMSS